jgi:hypothetical protein
VSVAGVGATARDRCRVERHGAEFRASGSRQAQLECCTTGAVDDPDVSAVASRDPGHHTEPETTDAGLIVRRGAGIALEETVAPLQRNSRPLVSDD